jgi:hypothetical protein
MQYIRLQPPDQPPEVRPDQHVGGKRFATNGETVHAELEPRRDLGQRRFGAFATGKAVGDNADVVTAVGLSVGKVKNVPEDSADRRAHRVQDTKRLTLDHWHGQAGALTALRQRNCKGADVNHTMSARTPCIGESRRIIAAD